MLPYSPYLFPKSDREAVSSFTFYSIYQTRDHWRSEAIYWLYNQCLLSQLKIQSFTDWIITIIIMIRGMKTNVPFPFNIRASLASPPWIYHERVWSMLSNLHDQTEDDFACRFKTYNAVVLIGAHFSQLNGLPSNHSFVCLC